MKILTFTQYIEEDLMYYQDASTRPVMVPSSNIISWEANHMDQLNCTIVSVGCIGSVGLQRLYVKESPEEIAELLKDEYNGYNSII